MAPNFDILSQPGMFEHFFETYPDGMCIVDEHGRLIRTNAAIRSITGYTNEELLQYPLNGSLGYNTDSMRPTERTIRHQRGHIIHLRITTVLATMDEHRSGAIIVLQDITEQRKQRKELLVMEDMFRFIAEKSENIITAFSPAGIFTYVSPNVRPLLGYEPEEVIGQPAKFFNLPEDNEKLDSFHESISFQQETGRFTGRVRHKNGDHRWYETATQFIRDESGSIIQTIGVGRDITHRMEAETTIKHMAYHDILTDLPNRRLFQERCLQVLDNARQKIHALVLLDLDEFKYVNDNYGHDVGDLLLIEVANRLKREVKDSGVVARLGGDEFTILQSNLASERDCASLVQRIKLVISRPILIEDKTLHVTASVGVAFYPTDGDSVTTLMKNADIAMYTAKKRKSNP